MPALQQILFGGLQDAPTPEAFAAIRAAWSPERKREYELIEAFRKSPANDGLIPVSGDTGATLEQVYNFIRLIGAEKYCLLSIDQAEVPTAKIKKVIRLSSVQMVEALKQINEVDGDVLTTLLHFDGQTGHCITLN